MSHCNYRITFSPNGLKPFTYNCLTFQQATKAINAIADFDLGRDFDQKEQRVVDLYKAYRREHSINTTDSIAYSTGTIDEKDTDGYWWIISEDLETRQNEIGDFCAFDNDL